MLVKVVVNAGLIILIVVEVYGGKVTVVSFVEVEVLVTVLHEVGVELEVEAADSAGTTKTEVVAVVRDTPLDGVTPFCHIVLPLVT